MRNISNSEGFQQEEITSALSKMLNSPLFVGSQRQSRFLQYIVEEAVAGRSNHLKGYAIGIEVFDRDDSFDPGIDSIVRVEAGRLRSKLREYYQTEGNNDTFLIELPKGSYNPVFSRIKNQETTQNDRPSGELVADKIFPENSVAVLPLRALSSEIEQEYFSDGMTDAIIGALANNKALKVISLTSVMRFKNTDKPIKQIASELNVSNILEGTILKDGNNIRITAQLIESATDFHIWGESFERKLEGILELQREIADLIANRLTKGIAGDSGVANKMMSISPEAYEAYLLGRRTRQLFTKEAIYKAAGYFEQAINLESSYAQAYSGMASCYCGLGSHGFELEASTETIPRGIEFAKKAIALDDSLVDPHTYLGIMKLKYEWDWSGAEQCFKKALAISPNDAQAHMQYSMYFESLGEVDKAIEQAQRAQLVDPLSKEVNMNLAWQYYQADRFEEARKCLEHLLIIEPDFWGAYWDIAHIHLAEHEYGEAISAFIKSDNAEDGFCIPLQGLGYAYALDENKKEAIKVIKSLERFQEENFVSPYYYATIYMGLNDIEKTFEFLEAAYQVRSRSLAWLNVSKEFIPLRNDKRFKDLIRRIGIPS